MCTTNNKLILRVDLSFPQESSPSVRAQFFWLIHMKKSKIKLSQCTWQSTKLEVFFKLWPSQYFIYKPFFNLENLQRIFIKFSSFHKQAANTVSWSCQHKCFRATGTLVNQPHFPSRKISSGYKTLLRNCLLERRLVHTVSRSVAPG